MLGQKKVFRFILTCFLIYFLVSLILLFTDTNHKIFENINLVKEIFIDSNKAISILPQIDSTEFIQVEKKDSFEFNLYKKAGTIINFNTDHTKSSIPNFIDKLYQQSLGKKRKLRIAYFGDSMIEGDLISQTLRNLLQIKFGGTGVGFVPINSISAGFRQTAITNAATNWTDLSFKDKKKNLFFSGHVFSTSNGFSKITNKVNNDSVGITEKSLLCGMLGHSLSIQYNNNNIKIQPDKLFNRLVLSKDINNNIQLSVQDAALPVFGLSFVSVTGIIVDNFSFRGITGIEYSSIENPMLEAINSTNPYDLIIFQFGVNMLYKPNDTHFNWYAKAITPIINNFKNKMPNTEIIIVSTGDRAFKYNGAYLSAIGIDSLIKVQAKAAFETNSCFFNLFETMGGKNSIVKWADSIPSFANKDYTHPNFRGAEVIGKYFYNAILKEYEKYKLRK